MLPVQLCAVYAKVQVMDVVHSLLHNGRVSQNCLRVVFTVSSYCDVCREVTVLSCNLENCLNLISPFLVLECCQKLEVLCYVTLCIYVHWI